MLLEGLSGKSLGQLLSWKEPSLTWGGSTEDQAPVAQALWLTWARWKGSKEELWLGWGGLEHLYPSVETVSARWECAEQGKRN